MLRAGEPGTDAIGQKAVRQEHKQRKEHEHRTQQQQLQLGLPLFCADEVWKKAQEENGELGIENIDEKRAQNNRSGGKTGPLCGEGEPLVST